MLFFDDPVAYLDYITDSNLIIMQDLVQFPYSCRKLSYLSFAISVFLDEFTGDCIDRILLPDCIQFYDILVLMLMPVSTLFSCISCT